MNPLLVELATTDFDDSMGVVLPPIPQRHALQRSHYVRRIATALRYGQITDRDIRGFVSELLQAFRPGELFMHEMALAAIAVAMEHWDDPVADEYLIDLARVERPEFRVAYRIARECLKARYAFPQTLMRTARYSTEAETAALGRNKSRAMRMQAYEDRVPDLERIQTIRYPEACHAKS
jgi:hypothetical protein